MAVEKLRKFTKVNEDNLPPIIVGWTNRYLELYDKDLTMDEIHLIMDHELDQLLKLRRQ